MSKFPANVPGMVFQFHQFPDNSLTVLYVSPGCWELCEVVPETFYTNFAILHQLIYHQDISAFLESMAHAAANCTSWFWEGRLITKGGRLKWIQGKAQLELLPDGIILWNGLFIDITDHKQAEFRLQEQLNQSEARYQAILTALEHQVEERNTQLQQKMQELARLQRIKDVILHTIAHDLRTTVIGNLMVVQHLLNNQHVKKCPNAHPTHPPISRVILERMIQGNERQLNMIDSLLEIHYSEKQGIPLNCQKIPFFDLINQILTDLQPLFSHNQATINHLIRTDLPLVFVDVCCLQKVLANLFTHSLHQNPPGLNLVIKVEVEAEMIYTEIQHNGVTMSQTECDRLFDLYVRDPQSPCSTSIGLKLYLCRQIIQAHGGEIGVISQQNQGLTFWFTLPIASV